MPRWVVWRYVEEIDKETGEVDYDKPPLNARGGPGSSTNARTWSTFETAIAAYDKGGLDGIGFVVATKKEDSGTTIIAVDLDHCRDRRTGTIEPWAQSIITKLDSYTEGSPSGEGIRIFLRGKLPPQGRKRGNFECYCTGRYVTVTGQRIDFTTSEIEERESELLAVHKKIWPELHEPKNPSGGGTAGTGDLSDLELIEKAKKADKGAGPKFAALWSGDRGGYNSPSEADLALCNYLAFWCGPNSSERIDALFRQSGLFRAKWNREYYRDRTIRKALEGRSEFYSPRRPQSPNGHHQQNGHITVEKPSDPDPWDDPLPLGEVPEVGPFPVDVLPAPARRVVEEIAWAMNCAPDLAGVALLSLASGAIANARHLAITETHHVSPCLYAVVVAPPGMAKSPPLRLLRRPFDLTENDNRKKWKTDLDKWKECEKEDRGPKPMLQRCQVSNITTESLQIILDENPRGVLMIRNELSGLVAGMNQYKSGGDDRQFYLDLWDGTPIITDRKSDRSRDGAPVFVLDAFTTIYGTIQPDVISTMRAQAGRRQSVNDGFLDRFLFAYPRDMPAVGEQWRAVSNEARSGWEDAVKELLELKMREQSGKPPRPETLTLSADGQRSWQRFTERMATEMNAEDFPPHLRGPWVKLRAYGARLALILRCLRWAYRDKLDVHDALEEVDGESMEAAARLVDYFRGHARKVYASIDADPDHREAKRVLRWLGNSLNCLKSLRGFRVVSKSEMHSGVWGGSKDVDEVGDIIAVLVRYGWLRLVLEEQKKGPGRHASPRYEIHPSVFKTPSENSENSENCSREPGEEG